MRKPLLRAVLFAALAVTIAAKAHSITLRDDLIKGFDISSAIQSELRANGLTILENPDKPPKVLSSAVYFQRPGCDRRSVVVPLAFNFESSVWVGRVAAADYRRTYAYAGLAFAEQKRIAVFMEWLKQSSLALIGKNRFIPVKTAIVVAEPPECTLGPAITWSRIWDRELQDLPAGDKQRTTGADHEGRPL